MLQQVCKMADSQSNATAKGKELQFRILDALYDVSKGNKYFVVSFDNLYERLQSKDDKGRESILGALQYLDQYGLVESRGLGTISIAHQGIKVYEEAILNPTRYTSYFPLYAIELASTNSKKNEIRDIKNKRDAFLHEVYKLSGKLTTQIVRSSEVLKILRYDSETFQNILIYLVDEGFLKSLAIGGDMLTITFEGIEQVQQDHSS